MEITSLKDLDGTEGLGADWPVRNAATMQRTAKDRSKCEAPFVAYSGGFKVESEDRPKSLGSRWLVIPELNDAFASHHVHRAESGRTVVIVGRNERGSVAGV